MTSSYILIAAILILGGLIAALGDRLGTKVGKAKLRLFNLRPRQTAVVVTMVTGTLIAASTLGILLALSSSLRSGLFRLEEIQKQRRQVEKELTTVTQQKERVSQELSDVKVRQEEIRDRLSSTTRYFKQAKGQLIEISKQAGDLRTEVKKLLTERQSLLKQQVTLREQSQLLQKTTLSLRNDLNNQKQEIAQQDKVLTDKEERLKRLENRQKLLQKEIGRQALSIASLDRKIADKDSEISKKEAEISRKDEQLIAKEKQSQKLQQQLQYLNDRVSALEEYYRDYQDLRARQIALVRGQVLALAAIRIVDPQATTSAIDRLLTQANRRAIEATQQENSDLDRRVVKITKSQVDQLKNQIEDGKDYVVRIISAGNYVQGETEIRVFADVALNRQIFRQGQTIATVSIEPSAQTVETNIQQRLDLLLSAAQFRARSAGMLGDIQVENGSITILIEFLNALRDNQGTIEEIQAVTAEDASTIGPLKLHLYALRNRRIIFSTETISEDSDRPSTNDN
jgi:uncharacterized protein (DUF3084 family)